MTNWEVVRADFAGDIIKYFGHHICIMFMYILSINIPGIYEVYLYIYIFKSCRSVSAHRTGTLYS